MAAQTDSFKSVYGPVLSWRFGRSLGIDPIGQVSVCSFDCVYCQLGEIEIKTRDRQCFIPTSTIEHDLQLYAPWEVDRITLSGSGEPTLALNLGEILTLVTAMTHKPTAVLTNGTLLDDPTVRSELAIANAVAVKLDAVTQDQWRRVNRPVATSDYATQWPSLMTFRQEYTGQLLIQTMLLSPWSEEEQDRYIAQMQALKPDEIQLNTPTRPKPLHHQLEARGNHNPVNIPYPSRWLKPVQRATLETFGDRLWDATQIPVRIPNLGALSSSS